MIAILLPPGVTVAEVIGDDPEATLLPEEEIALGNVLPVRRRQFSLGRACARRAMAQFGLHAVAVLPGPNREPVWPAGVVGSITHYRGYTAAAVATQAAFATVGIDAETNEKLPDSVVEAATSSEERAWLAKVAGSGVHWDRVLFSAKESVYKSWYPLTRGWLGFEDVVLTVDPNNGTFQARLRREGPPYRDQHIDGFDGRYIVTGGFVLTAVAVAAG